MTIEYKEDAKDCELCHPEGICCYCKNISCYELEKQLDQLKFENKVLKQYKSSKQASYEEIQNLWNIVELKNRKLSQTITEIKEIAERDKEFCIKCNGDKKIDCIDCIEGDRALLAKDILQKISEVEDEK